MTADRNHFFAKLIALHGAFTDKVAHVIQDVWVERDYWLRHRGVFCSQRNPVAATKGFLWGKDDDFDAKVGVGCDDAAMLGCTRPSQQAVTTGHCDRRSSPLRASWPAGRPGPRHPAPAARLKRSRHTRHTAHTHFSPQWKVNSCVFNKSRTSWLPTVTLD